MCCSSSASRRVNSSGGGGSTTAEGSPSLFFPSPLTNERQAIQPNFKWTLLLYKLGLLGQFPTARQPKTPTAEPSHACSPFAHQPRPRAEDSRSPADQTRERPQPMLRGPPVRRLSHSDPGHGIERGSLSSMHGTLGRSTSAPSPSSPRSPLTPRQPHANPRHCPRVYLQPGSWVALPQDARPGGEPPIPGAP